MSGTVGDGHRDLLAVRVEIIDANGMTEVFVNGERAPFDNDTMSWSVPNVRVDMFTIAVDDTTMADAGTRKAWADAELAEVQSSGMTAQVQAVVTDWVQAFHDDVETYPLEVPALARLKTHQPAMHGFRVSEVPMHSIMSIYTADGPAEVEIVDRVEGGEFLKLVFANGAEVPYHSHSIVYVFVPLEVRV